MSKRKAPFTDPTQLGALNQEVWKSLEGAPGTPEEIKPETDAAPSSPGAVLGDEAGSPAPNPDPSLT